MGEAEVVTGVSDLLLERGILGLGWVLFLAALVIGWKFVNRVLDQSRANEAARVEEVRRVTEAMVQTSAALDKMSTAMEAALRALDQNRR